jgi:hypothetical protein
VKRKHFGQEIPEYPGINARDLLKVCRMIEAGASGGEWNRLASPREGCAVGLSKRADRSFHHVGIFTEADGGLVVHAVDGANVLAQTIASLKAFGFGRIEFYEYGPYC